MAVGSEEAQADYQADQEQAGDIHLGKAEWDREGSQGKHVPSCLFCCFGLGLFPHSTSVPLEPEDQQGIGQERGTDEEETKGEMERGRKTRKGRRMKQREKECISINLCHPEGGVLFFVKVSGLRRP